MGKTASRRVLRFSGAMLKEPDRVMALVWRLLEGGSDGPVG
jgi:hypothetical protein